MVKSKWKIGICCLVVIVACNTDIPLKSAPKLIHLREPERFVKMQIPKDNPLTLEGIELGRRLFFDPILSEDQTISCASCHQPNKSFTDGKAIATGIKDRKGRRSAPSLINVGYYYKGLFWDGRVTTLEEQALIPIEDSLEMDSDWGIVEDRLQNHYQYPALFAKAFGTKEINRYLVAKALAQFERSLVSYNSKYDQVMRGEQQFTPSEQRGFEMFFDASEKLPFTECGHCHLDPLFTNLDFFNNGLEESYDLQNVKDKGRGAITKRIYDNGKFKTPSLRNIELTAPYMHDGRFETLEEVIDHYSAGGKYGENVNPNVRKLQLSAADKRDLIAFLRTLTDTTYLIQKPYDI